MYGLGKLSNGETFGLVDRQMFPYFYIREINFDKAHPLIEKAGVSWCQTDFQTMDGDVLVKIFWQTYGPLRTLIENLADNELETFEADIPITKRYLIDQGIRGMVQLDGDWKKGKLVDWVIINPDIQPENGEPELAICSIDIETTPDISLITAVSVIGKGLLPKNNKEIVLVVGSNIENHSNSIFYFPDEKALLLEFSRQICAIDPDILTGWNVIDFDFKVLEERFKFHNIPFRIGRSIENCYYRESQYWGSSRVIVYGRQVLDAMHLVRFTLNRYNDYRLETVAQSTLGRGKLLKVNNSENMVDHIQKAFNEDQQLFAEYCLEDARLVLEILEKEDLIRLTLNRGLLTGLSLEQAWGSVAAFEFLYFSELVQRKRAAPTTYPASDTNEGAPGGYVFQPQVGLYDNIFVFDFKSLYPSIIRTLNIDPLAMAMATRKKDEEVITTINNVRFDRERGILPGMLDIFFDRRASAKADGNDLASYTYKIVMNSFYGVFGTSTCRFASSKIVGSITYFGAYLLRWCKDVFEKQGFTVLYGDTDSLFVDIGLSPNTTFEEANRQGNDICKLTNQKLSYHILKNFGVESRLELEFEKLYSKLLLPPSRGETSRGRAKGYAGLIRKKGMEELQIVGMEAVRRDWTDVSHEFQRGLFDLLFHDATDNTIESYVLHNIREIRSGKKNDKLVYRKALRKSLESYTKTTPPHVKAARLLDKPSGVIHYVMTIDGPQPVDLQTAPMDYGHYITKQIEPIVRTIVPFCNIDLHAALTGERQLF
jgi:DNA polymerase-2